MLKINNKEYKVISSKIKYVNSTHNKEKYFSILVNLNIELNGNNGYIKFYIDGFEKKNIKDIENKRFVDIPTKLDSKINMVEIFDTKNFIDFIDSDVIVEFKNIIKLRQK